MSLLKRVEAHKGLAPREEAVATPVAPPVATPVLRPSSTSTQALAREDQVRDIRLRLQHEIGTLSSALLDAPMTEAAATIEGVVGRFLQAESFPLTAAERKGLVEELVGEVEGLGPLEPLLHDGSITE